MVDSVFRIYNPNTKEWWGRPGWVKNPADAYWFKHMNEAERYKPSPIGCLIEEITYNRYKPKKYIVVEIYPGRPKSYIYPETIRGERVVGQIKGCAATFTKEEAIKVQNSILSNIRCHFFIEEA